MVRECTDYECSNKREVRACTGREAMSKRNLMRHEHSRLMSGLKNLDRGLVCLREQMRREHAQTHVDVSA